MRAQGKDKARFQSRQVPELGSFSRPHSSGLKNVGVKGLKNLPWFLKKPSPVAEGSLHGAQRGYSVKLWRWSLISLGTPRCSGARPKGHLPRRATRSVLNQPKKERYCSPQSWEETENHRTLKLTDIRHGATGFGGCPAGFQSRFGPAFPHCALSLPFEMVMGILCYRVLEVCFGFCFCRGLQLRALLESQKRLQTFK